MSICVVGVPLPGMEALGGQHDVELAVVALEDVAFADRTGDDFHGQSPCRNGNGGSAQAPRRQEEVGRGALASRVPRPGSSEITDDPTFALVATGRLCSPPAGPRRPRCAQAAAMRADFLDRWISRGRDTPALQVSPGNETHISAFATGHRSATRRGRCTCSPRRNSPARNCWPAAPAACSRLRPRLPQPRARPPAPSRIHHAGMVSGADRRHCERSQASQERQKR